MEGILLEESNSNGCSPEMIEIKMDPNNLLFTPASEVTVTSSCPDAENVPSNIKQSILGSLLLESPVTTPSKACVFSNVKARLSSNFIHLISGDVCEMFETMFQYLAKDYKLELVDLDGEIAYYVECGLGDLLDLENILTDTLQRSQPSQSLTESTKKETPASKCDKAIMCDIFMPKKMSSFAMEHPRPARFNMWYHRRSPSPVSKIKEKYGLLKRRSKKKDAAEQSQDAGEVSSLLQSVDVNQPSSDHSPIQKLANDNASEKENEEVKKRKEYERLAPFKFFCDQCSFKSKRDSHFQKHMEIHKKVNTLFRCDKCPFQLIRLSHMRRHEMSHSARTVVCDQCNYHTDNSKLLARHIKMKHECEASFSPQSALVTQILKCPECPYTTVRQARYKRHMRVHEGAIRNVARQFQCTLCVYKTGRKEHLLRHVNNVHGNTRPYLCDFCGKAFKRTDALKQHHMTHANHGLATIICEFCDKPCRSQAHLKEHQAVHSNIRSYLCEICGASFKTRSVQRKHIKTIHKNPRSFSCERCDKRFNTNYALRRHTRLHDQGLVLLTEGGDKVLRLELIEPEEEEPGSSCDSAASRPSSPTTLASINAPAQQLLNNQDTIAATDAFVGAESSTTTLVSISEYLEHSDQHSALLQAGETSTASLYLTTNFPQYS